MPAAMPCRLQRCPYRETCCAVGERKTKYACIVEADESLRKRMEGSQNENHEDHIAGKGMNSWSHHNLAHKFIPTWRPKVVYTRNSQEFGKACEDLSWNHCTSTPHRSETHGIAERAVRRVQEGTTAVSLQSGLNESCGQMLWSVTSICETSQIYYLMGRRPVEHVLGNHSKDRLFHLVH